jgi:hypothetical protein
MAYSQQEWDRLYKLYEMLPTERRMTVGTLYDAIRVQYVDEANDFHLRLALDRECLGHETMQGSQEYDDILAGQEIYSGLQEG